MTTQPRELPRKCKVEQNLNNILNTGSALYPFGPPVAQRSIIGKVNSERSERFTAGARVVKRKAVAESYFYNRAGVVPFRAMGCCGG